MTYIIPSIIAAVIVFFFARRLNKFGNEETVLAMDAMDTHAPQMQTDTNNEENPQESQDSTSSTQETPSEDQEQKEKQDQEEGSEADHTAKTIELIVNILKKLGCQPIVEDDRTVNVKYQGENFQFYANGIIVNIYDLPWSEFNINDPNAQKIREAINKANFSTLPMVLMTGADEQGNVNVLSRYQTILHPSCTINDEFIPYILNSFFSAQRQVREFYAEMIAQQNQTAASRRPVGFDTGTE